MWKLCQVETVGSQLPLQCLALRLQIWEAYEQEAKVAYWRAAEEWQAADKKQW
jgi:hypothetical protein